MSNLTKPVAPPSARPAPNPNTPQSPPPVTNLGALAYCVQQLKQAVDSLGGLRGQPTNRAVTFDDLISVGLLTATEAASPGVVNVRATIAASTVTPPPSILPLVTGEIISGAPVPIHDPSGQFVGVPLT